MDAGGDEDGPSIWSYLIFCTAFILVIIFLLSTFFNIDFNVSIIQRRVSPD